MKKFLLATMIAVAGVSATIPAQAQHYDRRGGHHGHHGHRGYGWVAPLVGGAIIGGVIANQYYRPAPPPVYYPQEPVYVNPPVYGYGNTTVCRPVQAIDQFGYRYWTHECYQQ